MFTREDRSSEVDAFVSFILSPAGTHVIESVGFLPPLVLGAGPAQAEGQEAAGPPEAEGQGEAAEPGEASGDGNSAGRGGSAMESQEQ